MVMMSDLPRDLVEEVLSRVPLTSLTTVRCTCRTWNDLSNGRSFTKKHICKAKAEFQVIVVMDFRVYLMSVNLHGIHNNVDLSIKRNGELISLNDANNQVDICTVLHCDGLLLCITKDINSRSLVVWNPYFGQTMWIKPRSSYDVYDNYAMGYESGKSNSLLSHKILRCGSREFELYSFKSNSWKVLDVTPGWFIEFFQRGLSLKGNTYWYAKHKHTHIEEVKKTDFLICFNFTTERFGPRLPLPFHSTSSCKTSLSIVGEEQLAVLFCKSNYAMGMEIWVTSKIEPTEVLWNKLFLEANMTAFKFLAYPASFFVDLKKNVAVVFDRKSKVGTMSNIAYIIGTNGYFKQVDLGESAYPLVCSYVPSSVKIEQVTY